LNSEIAALVRTLHETERRLRELTQGRMDAVVLPTGESYLLVEAQERLRRSEEQFRQLAENVTDVFWIRSPDMKEVHYISPAFPKIWGRPVEELASNPARWIEFIIPEDRARVQDAFARLVGDAPNIDVEYRIMRPDGEIRWVRTRGFKVRDAAGRVIRLTGIVTDNTERKCAELALRESEERFAGAFLNAPIGKALVSLSGGWLKVNRAICQMVGYSEIELLSRTFQDITHPDDLNADLEYVRRMLAGEISSYQMEKRYLHKRGHIITVLLSVSLVRDDQGRPAYFISQIQDFTERKRLEEELRQVQKMDGIGQLAGGVAHDFNNMLAVIQLQTGLLKAEETLSDKQLEMAEEIESSAQRAADLTRQLLLFSRRQPMERRDLDLKAVIGNIAKMLQRILGEGVEMRFKFSPEPLLIHADAGMIDQILLNLTINARDAMPDGGCLLLETSLAEFDEITEAQSPQAKRGSFVCLTVADTGGGIPPEILPKIFEPFFPAKEAGKGVGLGLATVNSIVQQHQGWISVYSEAGRGTTFRIYIPRQIEQTDKKVFWSSLAAIRGGTETILLAEDDHNLRNTVRKSLARLGYTAIEAVNGPDALAMWNQYHGKIDLLLTDMAMPGGMTGKQLARQLLQQDPKLKVIYSSGYAAAMADDELSLVDGVNFLSKPFEARKLAQAVRNCLDKIEK